MNSRKFHKHQHKIWKYRKIIDNSQNWHFHHRDRKADWDFLIYYSEQFLAPDSLPVTVEGYLFYSNQKPEKFKAEVTQGHQLENIRKSEDFEYDDLFQKLKNIRVTRWRIQIGDKLLYFGPETECAGCGEPLKQGDEIHFHDSSNEITHEDELCKKIHVTVNGLKV